MSQFKSLPAKANSARSFGTRLALMAAVVIAGLVVVTPGPDASASSKASSTSSSSGVLSFSQAKKEGKVGSID